MLYNVDYYQP